VADPLNDDPKRESVAVSVKSVGSVRSSRSLEAETATRRLGAILLLLLAPAQLTSQVRPDKDWRTIRTEHFHIHFSPELEDVARRAAAQAETAYVQLSAHLKPPRGPIDVLVTDDVDYSNGFATPTPSNRIVVYANPPVTESALRYTDDYLQLLITHELVHIFHLDRVGGVWSLLQKVFGRVPTLFVNGYQPRWITEGLAVSYESRLTGAGRVIGSEHRMLARSAALEHRFPRIDQLSYVYSRFPYGYAAYAYGSLFMDYLADTHGDSAMSAFIERSSRRLIPWDLNGASRRAFGDPLTTEYREWANALRADLPPAAAPMPGWENLTIDGVYASFPRWTDDTTLIYTGTPGNESYGAYRLTIRSSALGPASRVVRDRLARRHTASPTVPLPDGSLLYSELQYVDPFTVRSDLYVDDPRGNKRRLTRGARLSAPDARADGRIVAMQTVPAGTRLALVSRDGRVITPITSGSIDEQWAEPRWSPDGRHVAAIRWTRGGTSSVIVLDTTGRIVRALVSERTVNASPSWSSDGRYVYFSSDRSGITNLYRGAFTPGDTDAVALELMSSASTGLFQPQPSPSGNDLAAVVFKADGYHIGRAPLRQIQASTAPVIPTVAPRAPMPVTRSEAPSTRYSALRMLRPTGWFPFFDAGLDAGSYRFGALVEANDIAGRHAYEALLYVPTDNSGLTGSFAYRNAMFGQPLVDIGYAQGWENIGCIADASQQNRCIGDLRRRIRDAALSFTFQRPRMRTFSFASVGVGAEIRDYATDSRSLIDRIDSLYRRSYYYPRLVLSVGWSNTQFPPAAISPEDGFSMSATTRHRWRTDTRTTSPGSTVGPESSRLTSSVITSVSAFKSLDFRGYAHHVLALNVAAGVEDNRSTSYFEVGGVSGGVLDIFPGYVLGEGRRSFGVRGFDPAAQIGIYAFKASAEYRAPLLMPARGLGTLPLFFDRTSFTLFGEAGSAWCPGIFPARPAPGFSRCTPLEAEAGATFTEPKLLASAGAEFALSAAILNWDTPYRFRLGAAVPLAGKEFAFGNTKPRGYLAIGASF
jgi:hypothetical protein